MPGQPGIFLRISKTKRTMNPHWISRRTMIQRTGACLGAALVPSVSLTVNQIANAAGHRFRIGAVDWELTKGNDPGALELAAKLGFDGIQVDLGSVEPMRSPVRQQLYQTLARE